MKASEREEFAGEEGTARNKGNAKVGKETNVASNPSLHFGPLHQRCSPPGVKSVLCVVV